MQINSWEYSLEQIELTAQKLLEIAGPVKIWTFHGDLGMGKSTLIRALAKILDGVPNLPSPSFPIMLRYPSFDHYDFYRIDEKYLQDYPESILSVQEALWTPHYHFIEWSERMESLLQKPRLQIYLEPGSSENQRRIRFNLLV